MSHSFDLPSMLKQNKVPNVDRKPNKLPKH